MDWLKVIGDPQGYPNESVIIAPNGEKVTLGQIREAWVSREKDLDRRAAEITHSSKNIETARGELANLYNALTAERDRISAKEQELASRASVVNASNDDPYLGPALAELAEMKKNFSALAEGINVLKKNQMEMADIYLNEKWDGVMEKFKGQVPDGVTREALLKVAVENKLLDKRGLPDLEKAFSHVTEPQRIEKIKTDALEEGRRKEREEATLRSIHRPSGFQPKSPVTGAKSFGTLRDSFAAAAEDPEIVRMISGEA